MTIRENSTAHPAKKQGRAFRLRRAEHDPRAAALTVLSRVLFGNADSQAALDEALRSPSLTPTDKRLCTEVVYGVLRRYLSLEAFGEKFLPRPDKLPAEMRLALLLALYEMACLRIPHHASVSWAVNHVRNRFGPGLSRVANGALRGMQRGIDEFSLPQAGGPSAASEEERLSRLFAMPVWIVRLWLRSYGAEATLLLLDAAGRQAPSGLRLNRARPDWERVKNNLARLYAPEHVPPTGRMDAPDAPDAPGCLAGVAGNGSGARDPEDRASSNEKLFLAGECALAFSGTLPWQARTLLQEGKASRQSAAALEALEAFTPGSWELPIWDCCAGRGGKTLALLEQNIAVELASDPSAQRMRSLPEEYARLGLATPARPEILSLSVEDVVTRLAGRTPQRNFGAVLIDAPCSGLGTLSRRPEIRLRRTEKDLELLAEQQRRILDLVWPHVRPGGSIVYLTCTLNPAENELQIANFLARHEDGKALKEFRTAFSSPLREFFYGARIKKRSG